VWHGKGVSIGSSERHSEHDGDRDSGIRPSEKRKTETASAGTSQPFALASALDGSSNADATGGPVVPAIPCVDRADPVSWGTADYGDNETAVAEVLSRLL
jgi:hypothetical protein